MEEGRNLKVEVGDWKMGRGGGQRKEEEET